MDETKHLILIKGEDKTSRIESFKVRDSLVSVKYKGSSRSYDYAIGNVNISKNPQITDITEEHVVYHFDIPLSGASRVINFGMKLRITFVRGSSQVYDASSIRVETSSIATATARNILQIWTDISQHVSLNQEQHESRSFLAKQFHNLRFVSPSSVLGCYINGQPAKEKSQVNSEAIFPFKFNLSQKEALEKALHNQVSIIEGPPGTGKTQTILNILANLITQNKTVAVVSGNNAAVQNVHDKLEKEGYGFLVASLGNNENKARFFANPPEPHVSQFRSEIPQDELTREIREVSRRINNLMTVERDIAQLKRQLSAYKLEQDHFLAYYARQDVESLGKLALYRLTPEKVLTFLVDASISDHSGKIRSFLYKLKLIVRYGFFHLGRFSDRRITVVLELQRQYFELKIQQLKKRIAALNNQLEQESFNALLARHQRL
ncbi:MAG TPA: AAA domain-containing protein, partial [Patescibacteria group bacterium]|nr:AAA domain-containing protein [Patescibacteria group bacterium]